MSRSPACRTSTKKKPGKPGSEKDIGSLGKLDGADVWEKNAAVKMKFQGMASSELSRGRGPCWFSVARAYLQ